MEIYISIFVFILKSNRSPEPSVCIFHSLLSSQALDAKREPWLCSFVCINEIYIIKPHQQCQSLACRVDIHTDLNNLTRLLNFVNMDAIKNLSELPSGQAA